jgi:catechol 2,3-dioxygenase-like lactoylglutathione lyase family enzyme
LTNPDFINEAIAMHSKPFIYPLFLLVLFSSMSAFAQLTPMNDGGVTIGHVHLLVPDVEAHKKLWVDLFGAEVARAGSLELLKLPGIIILIIKGQPDNAGPPTVDHFALSVRDLASIRKKLASANIRMPEGSSVAEFPDGVRVELIEDKNLGVPVAFHHFHIYAADVDSIRNWYTKFFGGIKFPAGPNFPGGQIFFTAGTNPPRVPTKGHAIDHISFEVKGLPEFCKNLEAQGVKLDMKIIEATQIGLRVTFVTDPIGTRIELTEGLADK